MQNLKYTDFVPLSITISNLIRGIIAEDHINNITLQFSHGKAIVKYSIKINQLKEGVTFMAFAGEYCWRSKFIKKFFDQTTAGFLSV